MSSRIIIYWLPRILGLAFVLFLSLFSLDVFSEYSGWQAVLPFLIHLLPSFVLLAVVLIAWRHDWVGVVFFLFSSVFYVYAAGFDRPWTWYAFISGPAFLVAVLFMASWIQKRKRS